MNVFRFSRLPVVTPADSENVLGFKLQRFSYFTLPHHSESSCSVVCCKLALRMADVVAYSPDIPLSLPVWIFFLVVVIDVTVLLTCLVISYDL